MPEGGCSGPSCFCEPGERPLCVSHSAGGMAVGLVEKTSGSVGRCFAWEVQELGYMFLINLLVIISLAEPSDRVGRFRSQLHLRSLKQFRGSSPGCFAS